MSKNSTEIAAELTIAWLSQPKTSGFLNSEESCDAFAAFFKVVESSFKDSK